MRSCFWPVFSLSRGFPRPVCTIWWWFSCSSPSSSSLLRVLVGGSVQVGSWWCRLVMKKKKKTRSFLSCCFLKIVFAELWKSCENKPLWYQIYLSYEYFRLFFDVTPGQHIWQLSVGAELFLDSNLIYPSWLWGLSAVNMHPWTTCLPASASMKHIKWVLNWELFLLYWKCQSLLPAQLLEVYWQSRAHGSLSASHGLSMQQHQDMKIWHGKEGNRREGASEKKGTRTVAQEANTEKSLARCASPYPLRIF